MICPRSHSQSADSPALWTTPLFLLRDRDDFSFPFKDHDASLKNSAFHCLSKVLSMQGARLTGDLKKWLNNGVR